MEPKDKEKIQKKVSKIMFALNKLALGEEVTKNEDKNYSDINVWIKNTGENFSRSFVSWSVCALYSYATANVLPISFGTVNKSDVVA